MTAFSTERECDRRQTMMDHLVTRQKQLELTFENKDQRSIQRYVPVERVHCAVQLVRCIIKARAQDTIMLYELSTMFTTFTVYIHLIRCNFDVEAREWCTHLCIVMKGRHFEHNLS